MSDIVTAASIGAGANLAGGLIGAGMSALGARKADKANRAMLEKQLAWEREKFNTAHQVEVRDLKAAGINPILTTGGSGATAGGITPIASEAAQGYANAGNLISSGITEGVKSANETANTISGMAKTSQEVENMKEEIENWKVERDLNKANTNLARETAKQVKESTENLKVERKVKKYESDMLETMDPETRALTEMGLEILNTGANVTGAIAKINIGKGKPKAKAKAKKAVEKAAKKRKDLNFKMQVQPRF